MSTNPECEDRFDQPKAQLIGYIASIKVCASKQARTAPHAASHVEIAHPCTPTQD